LNWDKLIQIEDRIFTEQRLRVYGCSLAVGWAFIVGWLLAGDWIISSAGKLGSIDFCWIWLSGKLAMAGDPSRIYGHSVFLSAHDVYFRPDECLIAPLFDYPPTSLFLTYPLGLMPYLSAFAVWVVGTLFLYAATIYVIVPRPAAFVAAITPVTVPANILLGHNGFITAALIGLSLVLLERRPWSAGIFLGLLTYKPHFGVLFPLVLLASRNWRALVGAALMSVILGLAAAIAFGYEGWPAFVASLLDRNIGLSPNEVELRHQSIYGLLHWAGTSAWISWTVHLAVAAVVTLAVCAVWTKPIPHPLKAAALSIGSVAVTPYVLPYDLCILSIAVAFLVRDGLTRGFLPGERTAMLISFVGLFLLLTPVGPVGPLICIILLLLVARRIVAYQRGHLPSLRPILGRGNVCAPDDDPVRHGVSAWASPSDPG
jgi:arabinofuranan 3-O-arabinosyltransferase